MDLQVPAIVTSSARPVRTAIRSQLGDSPFVNSTVDLTTVALTRILHAMGLYSGYLALPEAQYEPACFECATQTLGRYFQQMTDSGSRLAVLDQQRLSIVTLALLVAETNINVLAERRGDLALAGIMIA